VSAFALPPNDDVPRDIGSAEIGGVDLPSELLKNGWVKLKDLKREPSEEDFKKREFEAEAKAAGKGLWNPHGPKATVSAIATCSPLIPMEVGTNHTLQYASRRSSFPGRVERKRFGGCVSLSAVRNCL
jgi:hypothetical protein